MRPHKNLLVLRCGREVGASEVPVRLRARTSLRQSNSMGWAAGAVAKNGPFG